MKKIILILISYLFLNNNALAEKIVFSDCAVKKDNFIFNSELWEKSNIIIDTSNKTVTSISIYNDKHMKKNNINRKNFIFGPDKLDTIIDGFAVRRIYKDGKLKVELIYDLKNKTKEFMQYGDPLEVSITKCN
jgi:hypothetical protein